MAHEFNKQLENKVKDAAKATLVISSFELNWRLWLALYELGVFDPAPANAPAPGGATYNRPSELRFQANAVVAVTLQAANKGLGELLGPGEKLPLVGEEPGAVAVRGLPATESWGNPATLERHFGDHGADFGSATPEDYAKQASEFLQRSQAQGLPTKIDLNGVIRVYDPATNTFGAFSPSGTTRTFFTPSSPTYWLRQPGGEPWIPGGDQ